MKTLLTFAHYLEAISFIENDQLKKAGEQIFIGTNYDLLITGEGSEKVIFELTKHLATNQYQQIVNLGVAASLSTKLKHFDIYQIKTSYAYNENNPEFHSFELDKSAVYDCISINHRAKNKSEKSLYSPMAEILDRELWANCFVAKKFKTDIESIKIISDEIDSEDFCQMVTENAYHYSNKLYDYFVEKLSINQMQQEKDQFNLEFPDFIHLTRSMKIKLSELAEIYCAQSNTNIENIWNEINLEKFNNKDKTRKQNGLDLISYLEELTNPIMSKVKQKLDELTNGLHHQNIKVNFKQHLENTNFSINGEIAGKAHLQRIILELQQLKIDEIYRLLNGNIDV